MTPNQMRYLLQNRSKETTMSWMKTNGMKVWQPLMRDNRSETVTSRVESCSAPPQEPVPAHPCYRNSRVQDESHTAQPVYVLYRVDDDNTTSTTSTPPQDPGPLMNVAYSTAHCILMQISRLISLFSVSSVLMNDEWWNPSRTAWHLMYPRHTSYFLKHVLHHNMTVRNILKCTL